MTLPNRTVRDTGSSGSPKRRTIAGVLIGTVLSSLDPQKSGRLQVSVPAVNITLWAPAVDAPPTEDSDDGYQVGDSVVVAFESGDPSFPVVVGRLRS